MENEDLLKLLKADFEKLEELKNADLTLYELEKRVEEQLKEFRRKLWQKLTGPEGHDQHEKK